MISMSLAARAALRTILCLFLGAVIGGCGGSSQPPSDTVVRGWVSAEEGISDARLTFYTADGVKVGDSASSTSTSGSFAATIKGLPPDFRVVAQGGMALGEPSEAVFAAEYRQHRPDGGPIRINPLTTMVSRYLQRHPSATLDDATAAVKRFLDLPEAFEIAGGLTPRNKYFSVADFMTAARENGGVNSYMDSLVSRMDSGAVQAFPPARVLPRSAGSELALALAKGAATYVGGEVAGWALAKTGLWAKDDATQQAVSNMESTLNNLLSEVAEIKSELRVIEAQLNLQSYTARVENNAPLMDAIEALSKRLANYAISPLKGEREAILQEIDDKINSSPTTLHKMQAGVVGTQPLMELWGTIAQGSTRFVDSETYNPKVQTQFEYFRQLQLMQLLLQVEYWHAQDEGGPLAEGEVINTELCKPKPDPGMRCYNNTNDALVNYGANIPAQLALLRTLPADTVADTVLRDDGAGQKYRLLFASSGPVYSCSWDPGSWNKPPAYRCERTGAAPFPRRMGRLDFDEYLTRFSGWRKPTSDEVRFTFPIERSDCLAQGTGQAWLQANGWPRSMGDVALGSADFIYPADEERDKAEYLIHYLSKVCNYDWSESWGSFDNFRLGVKVAWTGYQPGDNEMADWLAVRTVSGNDFLWNLRP